MTLKSQGTSSRDRGQRRSRLFGKDAWAQSCSASRERRTQQAPHLWPWLRGQARDGLVTAQGPPRPSSVTQGLCGLDKQPYSEMAAETMAGTTQWRLGHCDRQRQLPAWLAQSSVPSTLGDGRVTLEKRPEEHGGTACPSAPGHGFLALRCTEGPRDTPSPAAGEAGCTFYTCWVAQWGPGTSR